MVQLHRIPTVYTVILLLLLQASLEAKKPKRRICPIGFRVAYTKIEGEPICYRLKGPEKFKDTFKDCSGNLYTAKLYDSLNLTNHTEQVLWTEYKTSYPGGPLVDTSFTQTTGSLLATSFDLADLRLDIAEELCVVKEPVGNYTIVRCDEEYYRYCFVEPYPEESMTREGCDDLKDSWRFWSPRSMCLTAATAVGGGPVRATWSQSNEICEKRGGDILYSGWRYSNSPMLRVSDSDTIYPLRTTYDPSHNTTIRHGADFMRQPAGTATDIQNSTEEISFGALSNGVYGVVNSSYIFFDVICEKVVEIYPVKLKVKVDDEDRLVLTTNATVNESNIHCFTDSETYYPTPVKHSLDRNEDSEQTYVLTAEADGYYWCINIDSRRYQVSESNKFLWIREEQSLNSTYAIRLKFGFEYDFNNIEKVSKIWEKKLRDYIFYSTKYYEINTEIDRVENETFQDTLKEFKRTHEGLKPKGLIIFGMRIKKIYLDRKTAVVHFQLNPTMKPVQPGWWENLYVIYMKPVHYCEIGGLQFTSTIKLGCEIHKCSGDFTEGVSAVTTLDNECRPPTDPTTRTAEVTLNMPTVPEPSREAESPPEEQLEQVINILETLLNDSSAEVTVNNIEGSFDKVDELLSENVSLEIPTHLLRLLDKVGDRLDLNGSDNVQTVRNNVALLVANAEPGLPVNGLRIAASGPDDVFTDNAFEIIRDGVNSTHLQADESDAVVQLPMSVANSSRRISFVVFRNDRAFQTNSTVMLVNSRVLSINVENITQFKTGESVDIHFNPISDNITRNQMRTCAYWHFDENDIGSWSQDGCTFIEATEPGMLDTCRCEHLTHFAEILVSRTVFSEKDELALEYLTVIGCCLSIFGLAMVGITASLFRSWRRDFNNKIWLQLCVAIFLLVTCFLVVIFANFAASNIACMLTGIILHYSVLASFCWMLVAAVISYRRLVMVFTRDASHKLLRASAFAWGAPLAIVGILLSVSPQSYEGHFEDMTPSGSFCYPSGLALWLAVYAPIAVMLIANWTLFVLIVRSVFASRRGIQRHGDSNEALRCASVSCLLVFLFGLPWIFGLFAYNIVAAYLFTLTATFQGFVLFVFFVLGNKKTRDLWLNKLKIKQTRKVPVTSSTYTNRSTGPGWRGGVSGTVEAKVSKPRSLASSDDSRFS
ncbi:uncharacterized protein LOC142972144 isoform X2 [Anticarsia gemmatalis]|uniref:uncharacterized protein LOC142972144 isoform X2 n=1 Tax=Anticarsia gemmatalis TaxID=129554 RepID=UPI003F75C6E9